MSLMGIAELAPSATRDERDGLRGALKQIDGLVKQAGLEFSAREPVKIAPELRDGLRALDGLIARVESEPGVVERERYDVLHELRVKRVQFNDALVMALGLEMRAGLAAAETGEPELRSGVLVPGRKFTVRMEVKGGSGLPLKLEGCGLEEHAGGTSPRDGTVARPCDGPVGADGSMGGGVGRGIEGDVPADATGVRVPYTKKSPDQPFYEVSDARMRDAALPLPALTAWMDLSYDGVPVRVGRVVGEEVSGAYQPVTVVPAVSVGVTPEAGVVPLTERSFTVTARVGSAVAGTGSGSGGTVRLVVPTGWKVSPERAEWSAGADGKEVAVPFTVTPERIGETPYTMTAVAESGGKEYREGYHRVGYPGLVRDNLYCPGQVSGAGCGCAGAGGVEGGVSAGDGRRGGGVDGRYRDSADDGERRGHRGGAAGGL